MIGCSSVTIGSSSLASSTSGGRATVTAFTVVDEDEDWPAECCKRAANVVAGNWISSPNGPRISMGCEGSIVFRFFVGGGRGMSGSVVCMLEGSWGFRS